MDDHPTNPVDGRPVLNLGRIVATPGALESATEAEISTALSRHSQGDWGDLDAFDELQNDLSLQFGSRILSAYHTRVCFRVGDQDAKRLQEGFEHFDSEDLRKLKVGNAICRIGGSDHDFNLAIDLPGEIEGDNSFAEQARDHSRANYATPREEIEQGVNEQTAKGVATLQEEVRPRRSRKTETPAKDPSEQVETVPAPEPETEVAPKSAEVEVEKTGPESAEAATSSDPAGSPRPSEPTPEPDVDAEPTPPENAPPPSKPLPDVIPAAAVLDKVTVFPDELEFEFNYVPGTLLQPKGKQ